LKQALINWVMALSSMNCLLGLNDGFTPKRADVAGAGANQEANHRGAYFCRQGCGL